MHGAAPRSVEVAGLAPDPAAYQAHLIEAYVASQVARGFSPLTVGNGTGTLERFLAACGKPVWEVTHHDVDRVVGELAAAGMAPNTRRGYVSVFKGFYGFLVARKAPELQALFGARLELPVDEFNAARHVTDDTPALRPPPAEQRMQAFFAFLKQRLASCRTFAPAARDYAPASTALLPHSLIC